LTTDIWAAPSKTKQLTAGAGTSQYISTVNEHEAAQKHAANPASRN